MLLTYCCVNNMGIVCLCFDRTPGIQNIKKKMVGLQVQMRPSRVRGMANYRRLSLGRWLSFLKLDEMKPSIEYTEWISVSEEYVDTIWKFSETLLRDGYTFPHSVIQGLPHCI